jgi:hypothetical protein
MQVRRVQASTAELQQLSGKAGLQQSVVKVSIFNVSFSNLLLLLLMQLDQQCCTCVILTGNPPMVRY